MFDGIKELISKTSPIILPIIFASLLSIYTVNRFERRKTIHQRKMDLIFEVSEFYQNLRVAGIRAWDMTMDLTKILDQPYWVNQASNWAKIKAFSSFYYKPMRSRLMKKIYSSNDQDIHKEWTEITGKFTLARDLVTHKLTERMKIENTKFNELDKQKKRFTDLMKQILNSTQSDLHNMQSNVFTQIMKNIETNPVASVFDKDISNLTHSEILEYLDETNKDFKIFSDTIDDTIDEAIEFIQRTKINF